MAPWKLPLIVAGIVVPVALAFALGGAAAGVAVGAAAGATIVVVAVRQRPRGPLGSSPAADPGRRVLLVLTCPVEEPASVRRLASAARLDGGREVDVLVLAPASIGFLDRWASDVEGARQAAEERLAGSVAALAKAGVVAEAHVGDEDIVQAVEDQLQSFAASEVVLVGEAGADHSAAATELESRLRSEFRQVELDGG